jgi:hypothetical protein
MQPHTPHSATVAASRLYHEHAPQPGRVAYARMSRNGRQPQGQTPILTPLPTLPSHGPSCKVSTRTPSHPHGGPPRSGHWRTQTTLVRAGTQCRVLSSLCSPAWVKFPFAPGTPSAACSLPVCVGASGLLWASPELGTGDIFHTRIQEPSTGP